MESNPISEFLQYFEKTYLNNGLTELTTTNEIGGLRTLYGKILGMICMEIQKINPNDYCVFNNNIYNILMMYQNKCKYESITQLSYYWSLSEDSKKIVKNIVAILIYDKYDINDIKNDNIFNLLYYKYIVTHIYDKKYNIDKLNEILIKYGKMLNKLNISHNDVIIQFENISTLEEKQQLIKQLQNIEPINNKKSMVNYNDYTVIKLKSLIDERKLNRKGKSLKKDLIEILENN